MASADFSAAPQPRQHRALPLASLNPPIHRVAVIGPAGSGKSRLAAKIGTSLGLPVIHLDALFWHPGWVETPRPQWVALQEELVRQDCWIIDGHYGSTLEIRLRAADTIVFLDFNRLLCFYRTTRRLLTYRGRTRPDLAPGCPEHLDWGFLRWMWRFPYEDRPRTVEQVQHFARGRRVAWLHNPRQVRDLLEGFIAGEIRYLVALP